MLESEHPGAVHHVGDEHCLVLEGVDVVDPLGVVMFDHDLFSISELRVWIEHVIIVKEDLSNDLFILLEEYALIDLSEKQPVHEDGVQEKSNGEGGIS